MVEILDVVRQNGKVMKLVAQIGNIESRWVRWSGTNEPFEEVRMRRDIQVMDKESLRISRVDYRELKKKVHKIFSEDRKKKTQEAIQKRLF